MLEINMNDVIKVLNSCKPYLIAVVAVLIIAVAMMVAVRKLQKPKKIFIRKQTGIAVLLALVIIVNMLCFGPMSSLISLSTGNGTITQESSDEATKLCEEIAEEGIVLLKNENSLLPLEKTANLNVFGWASTNPVFGGTGSGSLSDVYEKISLLQGLENSGIKTNTELSEFYTKFCAERPEVGMFGQDWTLPEPTADLYSKELMDHAKDFSGTALIVVSRIGGEGPDLPIDVSKVDYMDNTDAYEDFPEGEHYLQLSQTEKNMVDLVCDNFENVIFVYNGANAIELGFVNEYEQIKSVIWCPGTGQSGFNALGKILNGEVNPSGKTSDTFVADLTQTPTYNNFGDFQYDNVEEFELFDTWENEKIYPTFVNYVEGIYVGYRFYETAAEEGLIDYNETVVYPFGYGLTYTSFEQKMGDIVENDGIITFDVTVTNTGDAAGKDVIEVYYNPPYTNGGIEKASANLVKFEKTGMIIPGEAETVTISFSKEDMASFDTYGAGAYVLEAGEYGISIRKDSHNIIEEKMYTVDEMITYDKDNPRSMDSVAAVNQFEDVEGDVTYLSRENGFANYEEAIKAPENFSMSEEIKATFMNNKNYNPLEFNDDSDEMPVTDADNGLELADMRGKDYDDEQWEELLDQLTIDDMDTMIALGGYQTEEAKSVGKVRTVDCDGPASINNNFTGASSIGFPSAVVIASTWNKEIAHKFGQSIGKMADEMDVSGWYAPAMNTHRSAFTGRNFEYYSEDGYLAGCMAANAATGAKEQGVYAYLKHFALNDQETNCCSMLCTWTNEQALREIYLKPFELAVKESGTTAIMSAYNYIGNKPVGADPALLNNVLRDEWGFRGFVLTDYFGYDYQDADRMIRNGNDMMLVPYDTETNHVTDTESATSIKAMRQASKNILYTVVNSRAYASENLQTSLQKWQIIAILIDVILAVIAVGLETMIIRRLKRENKE